MTQIQKTILHDEIATLLETIREQFETLNSFEGKIPILEFEILKDNVRRLYEKLHILQRMNDPFDLPGNDEHETPMAQPVIPLKNDEPGEAEFIPSYVPPAEIIEEVNESSEKEIESVEIDLPAVETPLQELEEKDKPSEAQEEIPKFDLFTSETAAFNDKLKEAREQSLGPRFKQPNTGDIKSLININEKFLFINELFDGDYKEYTLTIEIFNNFDEKGEAFEFLDSLLKNNLWNSTAPAFLKLKEIVEKKFS
jgi:hypothetical protein